MTVIKSYVVKITNAPDGSYITSVVTDGVTITGSGISGDPIIATGRVSVSAFAEELTFDVDKDLATVSGGTRTFTVAASGNYNGVGIVARISAPVAINFPAGSEAIQGSSSISTTGMNIILFRYFANYNGSGTDKVLYLNKVQAAL